MELGLSGKVAIVTGGTAGIGLATAQALHGEGAHVVVCGRNAERTAEVVDQIGAQRCLGVPTDVRDPASLQGLYDATIARFGGVDILVNNAGTSARGHATEVPDQAWQDDLDLKVMAHIRLARLVVGSMAERGGGSIVSVLAIGGRAPAAGSSPTAVSRAAGLAYVKLLSRDLAADGIRANAVCIGFIESAQNDRGWQSTGQDRDEYYADLARKTRIPLGRVGRAAEAANVITFLASGAASYVTGSVVNIDGGLSPIP